LHVIACALLGIGLWAACAGIGYQVIPRSTGPVDRTQPVSWRQPGIAACVGLAALVMLGGICVAIRIPWWTVVAPFLIVGLVLAMKELSEFDFDRGRAQSLLLIGAVGVAAFGVVALAESLVGLRLSWR
jgi:hypothetical protein